MTRKPESGAGKKPERPLGRSAPLDDAHLMESKRQCPAISKRTGERCKRFCAMGMRTCRWHGSATRVAKTAAAKRIAQASGYAADMLAEFMADPGVPLELRTKIAQDLLNRAGVNAATFLQVQVEQRFEDVLDAVLVDVDDGPEGGVLASPAPNIEDAEVVDEPPAQNRHDRAVFEPVETARGAKVPGGLSDAERARIEGEALRQAEDVGPRERGREAYRRAINHGAPPEVAMRAGELAEERARRPEIPKNGRHARVTTAKWSQG
jgi:hypothetical protein